MTMGTRDCGHMSAMSSPTRGEAGLTGQWRTARPVVDQAKCLASKAGKLTCLQCWVFCPEAVIAKKIPITVDLDYCKGCGICAVVCPSGAIEMASETQSSEVVSHAGK